MIDFIELLREQHRHLLHLCRRARNVAREVREGALEQLSDAVDLHCGLEERHLYPLLDHLSVETSVDPGHRSIRHALAIVDSLDASDPRLPGMLSGLERELCEHLDAEEAELFAELLRLMPPPLRRAVGQTMLETIAEVENANWLGDESATGRF